MRTLSTLALIHCVLTLTLAQTVHHLPFASTGNTIELTIVNTSPVAAANVEVRTENVPVWLKIATHSQRLHQIDAHGETLASFSFSVDKSAPVGQEQALSFVISSSTGETWTKQIKIRVAPPDRFELFQNYPNPFNPSTAISYQLSADSRVSLRIYDLLGREVATLVDQEVPAGYHQETWKATPYSSGMYIYQLTYSDPQGNRLFVRKTMLMVK